MIKCENCGNENPEGTTFCDECGEMLEQNNSALVLDSVTPDDQVVDETPPVIAEESDVQNDEDLTAQDDASAEPVIQTMYLPGGKEVPIREGDIHIISRADGGHPQATIKIDDGGISSAGIKVVGSNGKVLVTDMGSGNVIVGNVVPTHTETEVRENGVIYAGESSIFFG